jgi:hypothetical protein
MPVPLRKARARHERQWIGRISGWLPSVVGGGVALRLRSRRLSASAPLFTARRPQTEASLNDVKVCSISTYPI